MPAQPGADSILTEATGGLPEQMFRVGRAVVSDDTVRSAMRTGPWMHDGSGRPAAGALSVLLDDALGLASLLRRPVDRWSVTTELSFDVCGHLPDDGTVLHAEARLVADDATGGFAEARVHDGTRIVAVATGRGRYVPGVPPRPPLPAELGSDDVRIVPELLGASVRDGQDGVELRLAPSPALDNPRGVVHGGLATAASELAGAHALRAAGGSELATTSVRIALVRPTPSGVPLSYRTQVVHRGRSFGVVQVTGGVLGGPPSTVATVTAQAPSP